MEWKCPRCTLINGAQRDVCEVCDNPRPAVSAMHLKINQDDDDSKQLSRSGSEKISVSPPSTKAKSAPKIGLFDHFLVVNLASSAQNTLTAFITHKFSAPLAPPVSPVVTSFCFPDADHMGLFPNDKAFPSEGFTFVLTEAEGDRVFGFCRRFMFVGGSPRYPGCLCFLSRLPCFALFSELLEHVEARWKVSPGAVFPLLANIMAQDVPRPGMLFRVSMHSEDPKLLSEPLVLVRSDAGAASSLAPLFRYLSIDNVMLLFSAILCEKRILLCGSSLEGISECVHAASTMIFPLQWQHIFIPLLPHDLLRYTCAPMPFIIGLRSDHIAAVLDLPLHEVIVVSLDRDQVSTAGDHGNEETFGFPMPEELTTKLKKNLKENVKDKDALTDGFLAFFVILFSQARFGEYLLDKTRFDTDRFLSVLAAKNAQVAAFMRVLRHSQMFEQFCRQQVAKAGQVDSALPTSSAEARFDRYCLEVEFTAESAFKFGTVFKRIKSDRGAQATVAVAGGKTNPEDDIYKTCLELTANTVPKRDTKELKRELTVASFDSRLCLKLLEAIWERMKDSKKKNWRHGYKALSLLEHLMIHGGDRVVFRASMRSVQDRIEKMSHYTGASEREGDEKVQTAAGRVLSLVRNIFHLREVRRYFKVTDPSRYEITDKSAGKSPEREFLMTYQKRSLSERTAPIIPSFAALHEKHKVMQELVLKPQAIAPVAAASPGAPSPGKVDKPQASLPPRLTSSATSRALLADLLDIEDNAAKKQLAAEVAKAQQQQQVEAKAAAFTKAQQSPQVSLASSATSKALLADLLDLDETNTKGQSSALSPSGEDGWAVFDSFPESRERKKTQTDDIIDFFCS